MWYLSGMEARTTDSRETRVWILTLPFTAYLISEIFLTSLSYFLVYKERVSCVWWIIRRFVNHISFRISTISWNLQGSFNSFCSLSKIICEETLRFGIREWTWFLPSRYYSFPQNSFPLWVAPTLTIFCFLGGPTPLCTERGALLIVSHRKARRTC